MPLQKLPDEVMTAICPGCGKDVPLPPLWGQAPCPTPGCGYSLRTLPREEGPMFDFKWVAEAESAALPLPDEPLQLRVKSLGLDMRPTPEMEAYCMPLTGWSAEEIVRKEIDLGMVQAEPQCGGRSRKRGNCYRDNYAIRDLRKSELQGRPPG